MKKQNDKKRRSVAKRASALFGALIVIVSVLTIPLGAVSPNINQSWLSWHQIYSDTPTTLVKKIVSFYNFSSDDYDYEHPFRLYFQHYNSYEMGDGSGKYYVSYELMSLVDGSHFFVSMTESGGGRLRIGWFYQKNGTWNTELLHDQAFDVFGGQFEIFLKYCRDGDQILCVVDLLLDDGTLISKEHRIPNQRFNIQVKGENANVDFASTETDLIFSLYGIPTQIKSSDYQDGYDAGYDHGYEAGKDDWYDAGYQEGLEAGRMDGITEAYWGTIDDIVAYIKEFVDPLVKNLGFEFEIPDQADYSIDVGDGWYELDLQAYTRAIVQQLFDIEKSIFHVDMQDFVRYEYPHYKFNPYVDWREFLRGLYVTGSIYGAQGGEELGYNNGYNAGYSAGESAGEEKGYSNGYTVGYDAGFLEGLRNEWQGKLIALLREKGVIVSDGASPSEVFKALYDYGWTACADQGSVTQRIIFTALEAPVNIVLGAMNFDVFGVNIAGAIYMIVSIVVALFIVRIVVDIIV